MKVCVDCGKQLHPRNTSGYCRQCFSRHKQKTDYKNDVWNWWVSMEIKEMMKHA